MKIYCKDGKVVAWHDEASAPPARVYGDGVLIVSVADGAFSPSLGGPAPAIELADLKANLKIEVDTEAEVQRLLYITPGAGQAMTYSQKSDEAKRFLTSSDPEPADYPLLSAEVGITAPDLAGVAQIVNAAFAQWQMIGAAIEKTRLATKAAIEAATTVEEAQAAFEAASWPTVSNSSPDAGA